MTILQIIRRRRSAKALFNSTTKNPYIDNMFGQNSVRQPSKYITQEKVFDDALGVPVIQTNYVHKYKLKGFPVPNRMVFYIGQQKVRRRMIVFMGDSAYFPDSKV